MTALYPLLFTGGKSVLARCGFAILWLPKITRCGNFRRRIAAIRLKTGVKRCKIAMLLQCIRTPDGLLAPKKPANFPELPNLKQMQIDHNTTPIPESCDIGFEARLEAAAHDVVVEIAPHSSAEARSA
jgi:hypothetical protein